MGRSSVVYKAAGSLALGGRRRIVLPRFGQHLVEVVLGRLEGGEPEQGQHRLSSVLFARVQKSVLETFPRGCIENVAVIGHERRGERLGMSDLFKLPEPFRFPPLV